MPWPWLGPCRSSADGFLEADRDFGLDQGPGYKFQRPVPSNLLPPVRPHPMASQNSAIEQHLSSERMGTFQIQSVAGSLLSYVFRALLCTQSQ